MMGFWDGSGIISGKQSAPRSRQITTPAFHHSIFTGRMLFLMPNQQCRSTDGKYSLKHFTMFAEFSILLALCNGQLSVSCCDIESDIFALCICNISCFYRRGIKTQFLKTFSYFMMDDYKDVFNVC